MMIGKRVEHAVRPILGAPEKSTIIIKGEKFTLVDVKERAVYDTVVIGNSDRTGSDFVLNPGFTIEWFTGVSTKGRQFTNCDRDKQIPAGWVMSVDYIGIIPRMYWGNVKCPASIIEKVLESLYIEFKLYNDVIIAGPYYEFESGRGWAGQSTETDTSFVSIGVPASGAKRKLLSPIELNDKDSFSCTARVEATSLRDSTGHDFTPVVIPAGTVVALTFELRGLVGQSALRR